MRFVEVLFQAMTWEGASSATLCPALKTLFLPTGPQTHVGEEEGMGGRGAEEHFLAGNFQVSLGQASPCPSLRPAEDLERDTAGITSLCLKVPSITCVSGAHEFLV